MNEETWAVFEDDAERMLRAVEQSLLALENDPSDASQLDELFRELHTLKGSAGLLGLVALGTLAHAAEDLVDQVRDGDIRIHRGIINALLHALDLFRIMIEESADGPAPHHIELITPLSKLLAAYTVGGVIQAAGPDTAPAKETESPASGPAEPPPTKRRANRISLEEAMQASEAVASVLLGDRVDASALPPAAEENIQELAFAVQSFGIETFSAAFNEFLAARQTSTLPAVRLLWRLAYRQLKGAANAGAVLFEEAPASAGREDAGCVRMFFAAVAAQIGRFVEIATEAREGRAAFATLTVVVADTRRVCLGMNYHELDAVLQDVERIAGRSDSSLAALDERVATFLHHVVELQDQWHQDTGLDVPTENDIRRFSGRWKDFCSELRSTTGSPTTPPKLEGNASASSPRTPRAKFLRIEFDKVAQLMSLTGEIGMAVGDVFNLPALRDTDSEDVRAKLDRVEGLIRELQDTSAGLGLVPLSTAFERMNRLARDLVIETGKRFALTVEGGDTEIDKLLVDALNDPLIHLLRNAADHGLETPAERAASGKQEVAQVRLSARRQGEHVIIVVRDDGRGMNRQAIEERAIKRGLISDQAAAGLSDDEVWSFVFQPGFSTADKVSKLSGRGVGMDVVRSSIQTLGGRVAISSKWKQGTTVRIQLPLTLAFLDGMVVRVGRSLYVLPVSSVSRVFRVEKGSVVNVASEGVDFIQVEDKLVPTLSLESFFSDGAHSDVDYVGRLVVVVRSTGGDFAIPIDELVGNEQVTMKPLMGHLAKIRASAGCGLLRSGDVAIALNCERLRELGHVQAA